MNNYIAIDIGASSGRLVLSQHAEGQITLEEIHRFKNGFVYQDGHERWDIEHLLQEILVGLEKAKHQGIEHCYLGIDTWAVDYCLIDKQGNKLADPIAYRDARTNGTVAKVAKRVSLDTLYEKTGIQIQPFNTIFQLMEETPQSLAAADKLLLIPDYLGYRLTGKLVMEKTNASTMQLLHPGTQEWDHELLGMLKISPALFPPLVEAGTILGELQGEWFQTFDLPQVTLINVASHDTASAVIGTPGTGDDWAYISSGTWSLLGIETTVADVSAQAFQANYTNEWGAGNTIRFLKNIMGMWLIQEVARCQKYQYSYAELAELAATVEPFQQFIDVNDQRFLHPEDMIAEIQQYCLETGQVVPQTAAAIARCVYDSLALCYAEELEQLELLTGTTGKLRRLHIVGGGSNNQLLNQVTADVAQLEVEAGPSEATAIGNVVMQMICMDEFRSIEEARLAIQSSFAFASYQPRAIASEIFERYQAVVKAKRGMGKNEN